MVTRVTANAALTHLNVVKGHFVNGSLSFNHVESTCVGQVQDLKQGDWRKRSNDRPVQVIHTTVDTTRCL